MGKHTFWEGIWEFRFLDKSGLVVAEYVVQNALANEGERLLLMTTFRSEEEPAIFYLGLCNDTLVETDTLSDILNEPSGSGYSRQAIERNSTGWPTIELSDGDYRLTSKYVTFTASGGDIGPVTTAFLATSSDNTGKLVAYASLPIERTILDGDSAQVRIKIKLK